MPTGRDTYMRSIYMGAPVAQTRLANGAITNTDAQKRLAATTYLEPTTDRVTPEVTVFGGHSFVNMTMIEGDNGLILYDTGECLEDGERFLRQIRSLSDKPIAAILYSHSHYTHGTKAIIGSDESVRIIGHPSLNTNSAISSAGSLFPETAPLQLGRVLQQFNHYLPKSGPSAPAGAEIRFGPSGHVPVNTPVEHGQRMRVAGIEMVFFTKYGSDTDDCLTVHLPQRGVVLNNLVWPFLPNIYTLRGAKFRDPRDWCEGLKLIRGVTPDILVNTHARAVAGRQNVQDVLNSVIDGLSAILDQTLRGILRGLGPDDLRDFVRLPAHLESFPNLAEIYGEIGHFGPYLFNHALGWFDGDAAGINPLPPGEQAARLLEAMGGTKRVLEMTKHAFAVREYAWAAQLANYLYRVAPGDHETRALKAEILQKMGELSPALTTRSWYLSQARALRGEVEIPYVRFPNLATLAMSKPRESISQYRVRVDPTKAAESDQIVALEITDRNARHGWHLRRGVVEFLPDPAAASRAPDLEIATDFEHWLTFFSCRCRREDFLSRLTIRHGASEDVAAFFSLFDHYDRTERSVV